MEGHPSTGRLQWKLINAIRAEDMGETRPKLQG